MRNEKQKTTHTIRRRATLTTGWWRRFGILCLQLCLFWAATAEAPLAQDEQPSDTPVKFTDLVSFDGSNGGNPNSAPMQGTNGNLYGTTNAAGANGLGGNVFEMSPSGTLNVIYNFCAQTDCKDGNGANGLVLASDGNFYGTTSQGGANGAGTVFKISREAHWSRCTIFALRLAALTASALLSR
jgi:uncharacterized repeat protein (TIGR03803 family)